MANRPGRYVARGAVAHAKPGHQIRRLRRRGAAPAVPEAEVRPSLMVHLHDEMAIGPPAAQQIRPRLPTRAAVALPQLQRRQRPPRVLHQQREAEGSAPCAPRRRTTAREGQRSLVQHDLGAPAAAGDRIQSVNLSRTTGRPCSTSTTFPRTSAPAPRSKGNASSSTSGRSPFERGPIDPPGPGRRIARGPRGTAPGSDGGLLEDQHIPAPQAERATDASSKVADVAPRRRRIGRSFRRAPGAASARGVISLRAMRAGSSARSPARAGTPRLGELACASSRAMGLQGGERDLVRVNGAVVIGLDGDPGARVVALVQRAPDEPRVTAHRRAPPGRADVRLRRDGVLVIAQVISEVREQLHERETQIGRVLVDPPGKVVASRSRSCRRRLS